MKLAPLPDLRLPIGADRRKLAWLIISRVGILAALAIITLLLGQPGENLGSPIPGLALIVLALTLLYVVLLRADVFSRQLIPLQLVVDVLLTTWLVYQTGDVGSPFLALYLVIIFAASLLSSRVDIVLITLSAVIAVSALSGAVLAGAITRADGSFYEEEALAGLQVSVAFTLVAMLAVAILSTHLADRQRRFDVDLASATRSLADLRAFNERIIDSMRSGLITAGLDGRIATFNRAAEEITGFPAAGTVGQPLAEIFRGITVVDAAESGADRIMEIQRSNVTFTRPDGSVVHLGFTATPLLDVDGQARGVVLIFQDLTEVIELEQEVRRQEKLAALGALAAGLAHEIRNPLASMRGSVKVLASEIALTDEQQRLMNIILRESDRLNRTVTDFLAYARPAPFTPGEFDLKRSLADAVALLRNSPEVRDDHEIVERYPEGDAPFYGDSNQMRQIFWNLARNAIQAMPEGGRLVVRLERAATGGFRLTIEDDGTGMTAEQVARLFEPFASKRAGGTGLGMAIVYQFVKDHGGRISVDSAPGAGTRVHVVLPNRPPQDAPGLGRPRADQSAVR